MADLIEAPPGGFETVPGKSSKHITSIATRETVKEDGFSTKGDAERRSAIIMCRTAGHTFGARPLTAAALANMAGCILKGGPGLMGIRKGHASSLAASMPLLVLPSPLFSVIGHTVSYTFMFILCSPA